jgi:hypothetical protein
MRCTRCAGERFGKAGRDRKSRQLYRCTGCGRRLGERSGSAFWGYRFPDEVIALAVRWYIASARSATRASVRLPGPLPRRTGAKRPLPTCVVEGFCELRLHGVLRSSEQHIGEPGLFLEVTAFTDAATTSCAGGRSCGPFGSRRRSYPCSVSRFDGSRGSEHPAGLLFSPHG